VNRGERELAESEVAGWGMGWGLGRRSLWTGIFLHALSSPYPRLEILYTGHNKLNLTLSLAGQGKRW